jgi:hypothetical protein
VLIPFLCLSFFSCSKDDNPIVPSVDTTYHFDSARYTWSTIELTDSPQNLFVLDTDKVFIVMPYSLQKFNGLSITDYRLPDSITAFSIGGTDESNIYIGGRNWNSKNTKPMIVHANNFVFSVEKVPNPYNLNFSITRIFAKANDVFFSTLQGRSIIVKSNGSYSYYQIDSVFASDTVTGFRTLYSGGDFFYKNGTIKCSYYHLTNNDIGTTSYGYYKVLNFTENIWNSEYQKNFNDADPMLLLRIIGNDLYGIKNNEIYKYTGTDFIKILSNIKIKLSNTAFPGTDQNNFITSAYTSDRILVHWNGIKWSKEFTELKNSLYSGTVCKGNYYILYNYGSYGELKIGRPKK